MDGAPVNMFIEVAAMSGLMLVVRSRALREFTRQGALSVGALQIRIGWDRRALRLTT